MSEEFPRKGQRGGSQTPCYSVEARKSGTPGMVNGMLLHDKWERVRFDEAKVGVPNRLHCRQSQELGLLEYAAAQALRWWFHAAAGFSAVETRIVKHLIDHSYEEQIVGVYHPVGGIEAVRPDMTTTPKETKIDG